MKAIIVADLHTQDERQIISPDDIKSCDFIISVGDITGTKRRSAKSFGPRLNFDFGLPIIGVLGNHENWELVRTEKYRLVNTHLKVLNYKGLNFAGVGGVIAKRPRRIYHNNVNAITDWMRTLIKRKIKIDVFVMHEPPLGCFDFVRGSHRGVPEYKELLQKIAPKYLFVGHMHTYRGIINWVCGTTVVNSGVAFRGQYAILDFDKNKIKLVP